METEKTGTIEHYSAPPACPVCQRTLRFKLTRSKKRDAVSVMFYCALPRHFRGFVNDQNYVRAIMDRLETVKNV